MAWENLNRTYDDCDGSSLQCRIFLGRLSWKYHILLIPLITLQSPGHVVQQLQVRMKATSSIAWSLIWHCRLCLQHVDYVVVHWLGLFCFHLPCCFAGCIIIVGTIFLLYPGPWFSNQYRGCFVDGVLPLLLPSPHQWLVAVMMQTWLSRCFGPGWHNHQPIFLFTTVMTKKQEMVSCRFPSNQSVDRYSKLRLGGIQI